MIVLENPILRQKNVPHVPCLSLKRFQNRRLGIWTSSPSRPWMIYFWIATYQKGHPFAQKSTLLFCRRPATGCSLVKGGVPRFLDNPHADKFPLQELVEVNIDEYLEYPGSTRIILFLLSFLMPTVAGQRSAWHKGTLKIWWAVSTRKVCGWTMVVILYQIVK